MEVAERGTKRKEPSTVDAYKHPFDYEEKVPDNEVAVSVNAVSTAQYYSDRITAFNNIFSNGGWKTSTTEELKKKIDSVRLAHSNQKD